MSSRRWIQVVVGAFLALFTGAVCRLELQRRHVADDPVEGDLPDGPCIVVANHTSIADGPLLAFAGKRLGRELRFLGTAGIIDAPVLRWVFRRLGYVAVHRSGPNPAAALEPAAEALRAGEAVALYPEGRITRERRLWPERGKTGAVRLAVMTGAPIVPVAGVGAHRIVGRRPRLRHLVTWIRRPVVRMKVGTPMDMCAWLGVHPGQEASRDEIRRGTDEMMRRLVDLVEELRGEEAPDPIGVPREGE